MPRGGKTTKAKAPVTCVTGACFNKSLTVTYSHMAKATLPSAQNVFTSEFGMGSGGSRPLLPPGKPVCVSHQDDRHAIWDDPSRRSVASTQTVWVLYGQASRAISTG